MLSAGFVKSFLNFLKIFFLNLTAVNRLSDLRQNLTAPN